MDARSAPDGSAVGSMPRLCRARCPCGFAVPLLHACVKRKFADARPSPAMGGHRERLRRVAPMRAILISSPCAQRETLVRHTRFAAAPGHAIGVHPSPLSSTPPEIVVRPSPRSTSGSAALSPASPALMRTAWSSVHIPPEMCTVAPPLAAPPRERRSASAAASVFKGADAFPLASSSPLTQLTKRSFVADGASAAARDRGGAYAVESSGESADGSASASRTTRKDSMRASTRHVTSPGHLWSFSIWSRAIAGRASRSVAVGLFTRGGGGS